MTRRVERITVLIADDDPDDCVLASDVLREIEFVGDVRFVEDGDALLDYLRRRGRFSTESDWRRPDLILLDLYMPTKNGLEVLAELRADAELARIPVVVLTGSETGSDVERAYELGARSYLVKPLTHQRVIVGLQPVQ